MNSHSSSWDVSKFSSLQNDNFRLFPDSSWDLKKILLNSTWTFKTAKDQ
jgi:hypothetical protein